MLPSRTPDGLPSAMLGTDLESVSYRTWKLYSYNVVCNHLIII